MFFSAVLAALVSAPAESPKPFEFKDGDRIVWLGNTLVEREQRYGYWETALLAANADKNITLRNLGWSGDTVFGVARCSFDHNNPAKGLERMVSLTLELKPTVIFVSFGTNEAFEGKDGLPKFEKGLEKLLDALKPVNARIVLFTPLPFQSTDAKERNATLALYAEAIRKVADRRSLPVADVGKEIKSRQDGSMAGFPPLSENGMHLTELGYKVTDEAFLSALGVRPWEGSPEALERWRTLDTTKLREAVVAKNELFFHRWRPQNETYLFGFRKHEQGKNAKEVAEFDPLVAKAEEEIAKIRKELQK